MSLAQLIAAPSRPGRIHRLGFGWINIGGQQYDQDRVLHPEGVSGPWWRQRRHRFQARDALQLVADYGPEVLILGIGWMGMLRVDTAAVTAVLGDAGVAFAAYRTPEAAARFQEALASGTRAVCALHLTC